LAQLSGFLAKSGTAFRNGLSFQTLPVPNFGIAWLHRTSVAGVTDLVWDTNDMAALIVAQETPVAKRGPYKKKAA
jgi:hypothetical protein